jgi:hypothetical protein
MHDGGDVTGASERLGFIWIEKRRVWNGVDPVDGVAGAFGIGNLLTTLDPRDQRVPNSKRVEASSDFHLIPQIAFNALHLNLITIDLGDLRRGSFRCVRAGECRVIGQRRKCRDHSAHGDAQ